MRFRRRRVRPDVARRIRREEARRYIAGLRAAASWFEAHPDLVPTGNETIDLPLRRADEVRRFAEVHGLRVEEWDDMVMCSVKLGPIVLEAVGNETPAAAGGAR